MATQRAGFASAFPDLAVALLAEREVASRAQLTADYVGQVLPGTAVVVYVIEDNGNPAWVAKATAGEITVTGELAFRTGGLGTLAESKTAVVVDGRDLTREEYAHLDTRRTVAAPGNWVRSTRKQSERRWSEDVRFRKRALLLPALYQAKKDTSAHLK